MLEERYQVCVAARPQALGIVWGPGRGGGSEGWFVAVTLSVRLRSVDIIWSYWGAQGGF